MNSSGSIAGCLDKKTIFHQVLIEMPLPSNSLENILNMYGGLTELELVDI
jgi:hypothetical protein